MRRLGATLALLFLVAGGVDAQDVEADGRAACRGTEGAPAAPRWFEERRMTVLVDSVLLSGLKGLRSTMPCWRISKRGGPAMMLRAAERDLRARRSGVARLVVIGIGYNSLWQRGRRRYRFWARRFDREAHRLIETLRRRGARQIVWVTLREPRRSIVPRSAWFELGYYSWYFPYVNERLRRLDRKRDDVALAEWARAGDRPGITYDSIHLNRRGAHLMGRTIKRAVRRAASSGGRRISRAGALARRAPRGS